MQAVILASGRGTRMRELTNACPKPLLPIGGETLLDHRIRQLPASVDEVIVIVGYREEMIRRHLGDHAHGKRIRHVRQEVLSGSAAGLWLARDLLHGRFLVMSGDDLYSAEDLKVCAEAAGWVMVVDSTESLAEGGRVVTDEGGNVVDIIEGNHGGVPALLNTNLFALDERFFSHPPVPKAEGSDEFGLPQSVLRVAREEHIPLHTVQSAFWFQISSPEDLEAAEQLLRVVK